jgi:hypothetical protein
MFIFKGWSVLCLILVSVTRFNVSCTAVSALWKGYNDDVM